MNRNIGRKDVEKRLVARNYTCRYCRHCDMLIAHKHEIEHLLCGLFLELDPGAMGWARSANNADGPDRRPPPVARLLLRPERTRRVQRTAGCRAGLHSAGGVEVNRSGPAGAEVDPEQEARAHRFFPTARGSRDSRVSRGARARTR